MHKSWQVAPPPKHFYRNTHSIDDDTRKTMYGPCPSAQAFADRMQKALATAKKYLEAAQQRDKKFADRKRTDIEFQVGDQVLLSTANLRLKASGTRKLLPRYIGPFAIVKKMGKVAYELHLPVQLRCHNVFHVSLLQKYVYGGNLSPPPLPEVLDDAFEYEVDQITDHRTNGKGKHKKNIYWVQWKGYSTDFNTWEPESNLNSKRGNTRILEYEEPINSHIDLCLTSCIISCSHTQSLDVRPFKFIRSKLLLIENLTTVPPWKGHILPSCRQERAGRSVGAGVAFVRMENDNGERVFSNDNTLSSALSARTFNDTNICSKRSMRSSFFDKRSRNSTIDACSSLSHNAYAFINSLRCLSAKRAMIIQKSRWVNQPPFVGVRRFSKSTNVSPSRASTFPPP